MVKNLSVRIGDNKIQKSIPTGLYRQLKELSEENQMSISDLVVNAVIMYYNLWGRHYKK